MGSWGGRYYADVIDEVGPVMLPGGTLKPAPDGETYPQIAARVSGWIADTADDDGDKLVIMHGISSRVMLGVMTDAPVDPLLGAPIAPGLPQGSVTQVENGRATVPHFGTGFAPA